MDAKTIQKLEGFQVEEISANQIYSRLAKLEKKPENKAVLEEIARMELRHYNLFEKYTGKMPPANSLKVWFYLVCARLLGLTFALKLMETNERMTAKDYNDIPELIPIAREEETHEAALIQMINEEGLGYMGSVVLGLNDALVEFTGALAGFTLALNNPHLIALTGSITGIAAALSMGSSEYLSTKSEAVDGKNPKKAAVYTTIAYLITVVVLVLPFVFLTNLLLALAIMLVSALVIIALFNYYYAVAMDESFKKRFVEMAVLSFSVAGVSFLIGYLLKLFTGIEV